MSGLSNGFAQLFKGWGKGIGKAVDNYLLDAEARKAISDEVGKKFQSKIDLAHTAASRRADNIKDLGDKVTQSKKELADAQKAWQEKYNSELADAQSQRQSDIASYNTQLKGYKDAVDTATRNKQSIFDQLFDQEANYDPYRTIYTDVATGDKYLLNRYTGTYENISKIYPTLDKKAQRALQNSTNGFGERLLDSSNNSYKVINAFDKSADKNYGKYGAFNAYKNRAQAQQYSALRDADNDISTAKANLSAWQKQGQPQTWSKKNSNQFEQDFKSKNGESPTEYSFNGQTYKDATALDSAYQKALNHAQYKRDYFRNKASNYASERDKEIAQRIQDAKDIKKAKLALGAGAGAGALAAGAAAMYGGDDTDNTNNTDNTYTGEPDPDFNVEKEGKALLNDEQQSDTASINTGFDPDKADALASAAYAKGVEDGNSVESSSDLGNNIAASTGGHTIDDGLFELLKAMQDPHKANAVADYIYSRHGDDPDVQRLGWRGWLNKYYGDSLRSMMNIDPSGYNGMHVSGGL